MKYSGMNCTFTLDYEHGYKSVIYKFIETFWHKILINLFIFIKYCYLC